jgi:hypothetical protein
MGEINFVSYETNCNNCKGKVKLNLNERKGKGRFIEFG